MSRSIWLLILLAAGCSPAAVEPPVTAPDDLPVVVCLGSADVEGGVAELRPERPGVVAEVLAYEGKEVSNNAVLLRLDTTEAKHALAVAKAGLRAAQVRLAVAKQEAGQHPARLRQLKSTLEATSSRLAAARLTLRRQEDLFEKSLVNKTDVDVAGSTVREMEASVEAARARLSEAQMLDVELNVQAATAEVDAARGRLGQAEHVLSQGEVRAPSRGHVLSLAVRPGEVVGQAGTPAPVLFCPERPFVVRAEVEQELVTRVEAGLPAFVRDELAGLGPWKGTVARVGRIYQRRQQRVDPTQFVDVPTVECLVRLEPGHPPLRIGQRLRVSIYPATAKK